MKKRIAAVFCLIICFSIVLSLVPATAAGGETVSEITVKLPAGATTDPFSSSLKLSGLTFSSDSIAVGTVNTRWYENGICVETIYGSQIWGNKSLKASSEYFAFVLINARDGYKFTKNTKVSVEGLAGYCSVDYISEDGKIIGVTTGKLYTECKHSYGSYIGDEIGHYRVCQICAQASDTERHNWTVKTQAAERIQYTCSVCKEEKIESENNLVVDAVYYDLGFPFIGGSYTCEFLPVDEKVQASYTMWTYGTDKNSGIKDCEPGFKYEEGKYYIATVAVAAADGYTFAAGITKVYFRINGVFYEGERLSISDAKMTWCMIVTPASAPEIKLVFPDEIKEGDDLIKLSTQCRIYYNGKECQNRKVSITIDGTPLPNQYKNGTWSAGTDINSMINKLFSTSPEVTKNYYRTLFTAKAGSTYSFCINGFEGSNITVLATDEAHLTVEGAAKSMKVQIGDSLASAASYTVNLPSPTVISLNDKAPAVGDMPVNVTSGRLRKTFNTSDQITCGKVYKVNYEYYAEKTGEFSSSPILAFNGKITDYTLNAEGNCMSFSVDYFIGHERITETVNPTCDEAGATTEKCKYCNYVYSSTPISATGHTMTHVQAQTATCVNESVTEHYYCSVCKKNFSDKDGNNVITGSVTGQKNAAVHVGGNMQYSTTEHWEKCQCGEKLNVSTHQFNSSDICTVCGYKRNTVVTTAAETTAEKTHETTPVTTPETSSEITAVVPGDDTTVYTPVTSGVESSPVDVTTVSEDTAIPSESSEGSSVVIVIGDETVSTTNSPETTDGPAAGGKDDSGSTIWIAIGLGAAAVVTVIIVILRKKKE